MNGNSVNARHDEHVRFDALARVEHLRAYVREHGLGVPLLIAKQLDTRFDRLHDELARLHDTVAALAAENARLRDGVDALAGPARKARSLWRRIRRR